MRFEPAYSFKLQSPLSFSQAFEAMAKHVEPYRYWRSRLVVGFWTVSGNVPADPFQGSSTANGFKVQRIRATWSQWLSTWTDIAIKPDQAGARISVRISPSAAAYLLPVGVAVIFAIAALQSLPDSGIGVLGPIMLAALLLGAFWFKGIRQRMMLTVIFDATD